MTILFIILWLLLGVLATINLYYTSLKGWYITFGTDYRIWENGSGIINKIGYFAIVFVPLGLISFTIIILGNLLFSPKAFTFYFKIPNSQQ